MSTRAVDLQSLLFRLQDVQQIQTPGQQQPQVAQSQFAQMFVTRTEQQKDQVQNPNQTEGKKIREEEEGGGGGNPRQRRRQRQQQPQEEKKPSLARDPMSRIDVRV